VGAQTAGSVSMRKTAEWTVNRCISKVPEASSGVLVQCEFYEKVEPGQFGTAGRHALDHSHTVEERYTRLTLIQPA
jgi:hypothetical protein